MTTLPEWTPRPQVLRWELRDEGVVADAARAWIESVVDEFGAFWSAVVAQLLLRVACEQLLRQPFAELPDVPPGTDPRHAAADHLREVSRHCGVIREIWAAQQRAATPAPGPDTLLDLAVLDKPVRRAVEARGVRTLADLAALRAADLLACRGVGKKSVAALADTLARAGLRFREAP